MSVLVLTSGGDAPGMNAALRAVTRSSLNRGFQIYSSGEGFRGMVRCEYTELNLRSVANIIHRGGTVIKTSRCDEFRTVEGRQKAYKGLKKIGINTVIGLGGDGTIEALAVFNKEFPDIQVIGLPCTIDNDYDCSENTIGFATAVETAVEAIDKIRDTASSHQRTFVVEVMGRKSTQLAYAVAIAAGAEYVVDPTKPDSLNACVERVKESIAKGKLSSLIVTLEKEGSESSAAVEVKEAMSARLNIDCKSLVLGHIQRGGSPLASDRLLASRMGFEAAMAIGDPSQSGVVVQKKNEIEFFNFKNLEKISKSSEKDKNLLQTLAN
jgi:6-phosphofructokinase 1